MTLLSNEQIAEIEKRLSYGTTLFSDATALLSHARASNAVIEAAKEVVSTATLELDRRSERWQWYTVPEERINKLKTALEKK